jgi:Domain of unknown function (DUF3560)
LITIRHTRADGTLIEGSRKGDGVYDVLRGLHENWRSFPSIRRIGMVQSRDREAFRGRIERAATALRAAGYEVTVEIDDTEHRSFAEVEAERYERAEARADRMAGYAANAAARSDAAYQRSHQMAEAIPFGQPVMPDHYSYGRDMRYRDRIHALQGKTIEEGKKADHFAHRAQNAATEQASRESVPVTLRRIAKLEAEERQVQRRLDGSGSALHGEDKPAAGAYREQLRARAADIAEQLAYWRAIVAKAQESGVKVWSAADFAKGDYVRHRGRWYEVERVNPKTLSVPHGNNDHELPVVTRAKVRHALGQSNWTAKIGYDEVRGRKSAEEMAALLAEGQPDEAAG